MKVFLYYSKSDLPQESASKMTTLQKSSKRVSLLNLTMFKIILQVRTKMREKGKQEKTKKTP